MVLPKNSGIAKLLLQFQARGVALEQGKIDYYAFPPRIVA